MLQFFFTFKHTDPGGYARDRGGGGAPARPRSVLRDGGREEEEDHTDIRPEFR